MHKFDKKIRKFDLFPTMVDLSSFGISTISSLIGGGLLVFAITTFYTDIYNKPFVNIYVQSHNIIIVNNTGMAPATNLLLTVPILDDVPIKMFVPHIFSNENYTLKNTTSGYLGLFVHRLVQGYGVIKVDASFNKALSNIISNHLIYATYDQGSKTNNSSHDNYLTLIIFLVPSVIAFFVAFVYGIHKRTRKRQKRKMKLIEDIIAIKEKLTQNIQNNDEFKVKLLFDYNIETNPFNRNKQDPDDKSERIKTDTQKKIKEIFTENPRDRIIIDNFCKILEARKKDIQNQDMLLNNNKKCLCFANDVLEKIDWTKYGANSFDD